MNRLLITTETTHHAYFLEMLQKKFPFSSVIIESQPIQATFEVTHSFEIAREQYEIDKLFGGRNRSVKEIFPAAETFAHINTEEAKSYVKSISPDIILVYGSRKLSPEVIALCPDSIFNLHGGDPEEYRGLDSHLWSIYHGEYNNLFVTLHKLNATLDDGAIVYKELLKIKYDQKIHELRSENMKLCIAMTERLFNAYNSGKIPPTYTQQKKGRYYSFMPSCLKEICKNKFEKYTSSLGKKI